MYTLLLLIIPIIIGLVDLGFSHGKINLAKFAIMEGTVVLLMLGGSWIATYQSTSDVEIWNGRIASKVRDKVHCRHSYDCNCTTTTDSKGNSHTHCDTCYEHAFDVDWEVFTSNGEEIDIDREDRQGLVEPKRWDAAYLTEPTSIEHGYQNYIKANPNSLLTFQSLDPALAKLVPDYPSSVYDYYRCNKFLTVGVPVQDVNSWRWLLDQTNADLGKAKQVNIIVVVVNSLDPSYQFVLEKQWIGGKKNDVIVILGVTRYPKIDWVRISSWSQKEDLKVILRDDILSIGTMDQRDAIMKAVRTEVLNRFSRRHMKDLKYLMSTAEPGTTATVILLILGILVCGVYTLIFYGMDSPDSYGGYSGYSRY